MASGTWHIDDKGRLVVEVGVKKVSKNIRDKFENKILRAISEGIIYIPTENISYEQTKLIYALLGDLRNYTGHTTEELKEETKDLFCKKYSYKNLSLSNSKENSMTMKQGIEYVEFLFDYALEKFNFFLSVKQKDGKYISYKDIIPDINKFIIACIRSRRCCVCGKEHADLHHYDRVSSIGGYEHCDGLKTRFQSLCREHHNEIDIIGQEEFDKKYILNGVWLNEKLVFELLDIYKGHFKKFRVDNKELIKELKCKE